MGNFATEGLKKLYTDGDGFTTEDCIAYQELVDGAPLGEDERLANNGKCWAITEYVEEAEAGKSSVKTLQKMITSGVSPKIYKALTSTDWRQALSARFPYLMAELSDDVNDLPWTSDSQAIVSIGRIGKYDAETVLLLNDVIARVEDYHSDIRADAYVARGRIDPKKKGDVKARIQELASELVRNGSFDGHNENIVKEAERFASYPEYTDEVVKNFKPLLNDTYNRDRGEKFLLAVKAIAGGGERVKDVVPEIMANIPIDISGEKYFEKNLGDDFAHQLEKIIGYKETAVIRQARHYECSCW